MTESLMSIMSNLFGTAPTQNILDLYYVFALIFMLFIFRIAFSFVKAVLGIKD